jgi:hypothetical protein
LAEEPQAVRDLHDPSRSEVHVTCFHVCAPDDWEPALDWEHDDYRWRAPAEAADTLQWGDTAAALRGALSR